MSDLNFHVADDLDYFRIDRLPLSTTGSSPCLRVSAVAGVRVRLYQQMWIYDPWLGGRWVWSEVRSGSQQVRMALPANSSSFSPVMVLATPEGAGESLSYHLSVDYIPNALSCE